MTTARAAGVRRRGETACDHFLSPATAPPPGTVFFAADWTEYLHVDGIHVSIGAAGERAILAIARALAPMSR